MSRPHIISISPSGNITFIYSDELRGLLSLGSPTIKRVSHVEPYPYLNTTAWYADLELIGGPKLGPFAYRRDALLAERVWLEQQLYPPDIPHPSCRGGS